MKKHLKRVWSHCLTVAGSPLTWLLAAVFTCALFALASDAAKGITLWREMAMLPAPDRCALCQSAGAYGVCLLCLSTGELLPPSAAPKSGRPIAPALYCRECRAKLGEAIAAERILQESYILVDLRNKANILVYPPAYNSSAPVSDAAARRAYPRGNPNGGPQPPFGRRGEVQERGHSDCPLSCRRFCLLLSLVTKVSRSRRSETPLRKM